jgi:hypothetical protein
MYYLEGIESRELTWPMDGNLEGRKEITNEAIGTIVDINSGMYM